MHFAQEWINKFRPSQVIIAWDCSKDSVWRKKLHPGYKEGRKGEDIKEALDKICTAGKAILPYLNVHTLCREHQEADDLIYAAAKALIPRPIIIISGDTDMLQIPWSMPNCRCYDPQRKDFLDLPDTSPVVVKALAGDDTDNIDGYRGIGEQKGRGLARNPAELRKFLRVCGDKIFKLNLALVDISLNPASLNNQMHVLEALAAPVSFDKAKVMALATEHKVTGLMARFSEIVLPFKKIIPPSVEEIEVAESEVVEAQSIG
jgi:hypothetical protein